jgi:hypothetical protein
MTGHAGQLIALLPSWQGMLVGVLVGVLVWQLVTWTLAIVGGWWWLSKAFPAPPDVDGERFAFAFVVVGGERMSVSQRARATVGDAGFRLSVYLPSRHSNPPLFIPWREVAAVEEAPGLLLTTATVRLRGLPVTIRLRGNLAHCVLDTWARARHAAN